MTTASYSYARQNLKNILDKTCENIEPILITRQKGKNVIFISEEEYLSLNETAYLLSSPKNKKHIKESLKEIKNNEIVELTFDEL